MTAIYPGSFDPMTCGHLDIIKRAAKFSDRLIVAVLNNAAKTPLFTVEERMGMLREAMEAEGLKNAEVDSFSGLLVDYARSRDVYLLIRGLRAVTDFEYEFQLALTNRMLDPGLETLFISTSTEYLFIASSVVREIAQAGGDISKMAPDYVCERLRRKFNEHI
ncbi:MAG: pantetheine-phosphate adenylyltransferase [Clostridiales bacterium]|jgi:pantetheine-phosphate adenylyltransferase|nr:pantetheine-phosphate adenylyltransferase [Clostridiales bacterium]